MEETYQILSLAKNYILLGGIASILIIGGFLFYHFVIYKKVKKGTKKLNVKKLIMSLLLVCYIVVLIGATFLSRGANYDHSFVLTPFYSYKEAWNSFSFTEWRNIILNILLFVPFGFLIPCVFKKMRCFYKTYLLSFGVTAFIELLQLITKSGIFEIDDIMDNFFGAMIGYGLFSIIFAIYKRTKKKEIRPINILALQIPLVCVGVIFLTIFVSYSSMELGNISTNYIKKVSTSSFTLKSDVDFNSESQKEAVYKTTILSHKEARDKAQSVLNYARTSVNDDYEPLYYENTAYFHDTNGDIISVEYSGATYDYIMFSNEEGDDNVNENCTYQEVVSALKQFNIVVPSDSDFIKNEDNSYTVTVNKMIDGDYMYNGSVIVTLDNDNKITHIDNKIIKSEFYKQFDIKSQNEAYQEIKDGKFSLYSQSKVMEIKINDVKLIYVADSKGFMQPVYDFEITLGDNDDNIYISAIK